MKRKNIFVVTILLVTLATALFTNAGNTEKAIKYKEVGNSHKQLLEEKNSKQLNREEKKVAVVNKEIIYVYELEAAVLSNEIAGNDYTEEEILNRLIRHQVLVQKAKENGYMASDERVKLEINAIREAYKNNISYSEFINPYLDGLGMSFEEYIEYSEESLKNSIILDELKKAQTKGMEIDEAAEYWEEFVDKCIDEADIKIYKIK